MEKILRLILRIVDFATVRNSIIVSIILFLTQIGLLIAEYYYGYSFDWYALFMPLIVMLISIILIASFWFWIMKNLKM